MAKKFIHVNMHKILLIKNTAQTSVITDKKKKKKILKDVVILMDIV